MSSGRHLERSLPGRAPVLGSGTVSLPSIRFRARLVTPTSGSRRPAGPAPRSDRFVGGIPLDFSRSARVFGISRPRYAPNVDDAGLESTFAACETALAAGGALDLRALGFWRAVARVKRDRALIFRYAERIARIDRSAFAQRVVTRTDAVVGVVVLALGLAVGLLLLGAAASFGRPWRELIVLAGTAALLVATHDLAHYVVGAFTRIGFTEFYVDLRRRQPHPGLKIDYASYLRAPAAARAWMHASGAIVTKLVPFLVVPYALAIACDTWAVAMLLVIGVLQIITDVLFSVRASDWKKFRREMRLARRTS